MAEQAKRRQRTWSAFGEVRRMPTEYEIVSHGTNWTLRDGRKAPLEQNPSSPANMWFRTYRDQSPLAVDDWNGFRDPDALTYRKYVAMQDGQENAVAAALDEYSDAGHDKTLSPGWLDTLQLLFSVTRFPLHGCQQIQAYIGFMAPSSYITNAATFATADLLRRVSLVAYRTAELGLTWPDRGFGQGERSLWESHEAWQPARELVETALVAYDWGEAFTALDLVIGPTVDDLLLRQFRETARAAGDHLTWLLLGYLSADSERRARWSAAVASYAVSNRPGNAAVLEKWTAKWGKRADAAAAGIAAALENAGGQPAAAAVEAAAAARASLHAQAGLPGEAGLPVGPVAAAG
jgi:toluene monooxygenase system protein E